MNRDDLLQRAKAGGALVKRLEGDILSRVPVNPRQWEFICCKKREAMLSGGNQFGKSTALRIFGAIVAPGIYPEEYTGLRWDHPVKMLLIGESKEKTRDLLVEQLIGPQNKRGTGYIPAECLMPFDDMILYEDRSKGYVSKIFVRHKSHGSWDNDFTEIRTATYAQGPAAARGFPFDVILQDEEPEHHAEEIHAELSARLFATQGIYRVVQSPQWGHTPFWGRFRNDTSGDYHFIQYGIDDATHIPEERREAEKKKWKGHFQEMARIYGLADAGAGLVWPILDEKITAHPDFVCPANLPRVIGIDLPHTTGAFAASLHAYNPQSDVIYLLRSEESTERSRAIHGEIMRDMGGDSLPIEWPHDGGRQELGESTIAEAYRNMRLNLEPDPAHYYDGYGTHTKSTRPVLEEIYDRMVTGRFKVVMPGNEAWLDQKSMLRAKAGKIVKGSNDHRIDATVKAVMRIMRGDMASKNVIRPWDEQGQVKPGFFSQRGGNKGNNKRRKRRPSGWKNPSRERRG